MTAPTLTYHPVETLLSAPYTFSAKEKDSETGLTVTSLCSVSSSSLSKGQTSLSLHSLIRRFGARYYSSELSIWLSVDPMSDKYPSLSPYTYCANNPVKLTDPDGRWIPGLDDDGNVTYTAEKGDSYDTFIKQFDCRDADGNNRGRDIFSNAGLKKDGSEIKEGSVIKGDAVKQVTGNEVLKGNWNNMTDNQKAYQIKFAFDYGEKKNSSIGQDHTIDLNDFFHGFSTGYGAMKLNGVKIPEKEGNSVIMRTVNITIWPKDGLVNRKGQIPVYWSPQATGENYRMHNYYSAKNPSAGSKIPAITISY